MRRPWTDGPRELIRHAVEHLQAGGDFDRRIAMISVDNAVELMVKVYLGLPRRARKEQGPSRKELEAAMESFPDLLSLLDTHAGERLQGIGLDDIEWYHRLRNQLYHSGNGITVERAKVETYVSLARSLFEALFEEDLDLPGTAAQLTEVGQFMEAWIELEREERARVGNLTGSAKGIRLDHAFASVNPNLVKRYLEVRRFRNDLVHGLSTPNRDDLKRYTLTVRELTAALRNK